MPGTIFLFDAIEQYYQLLTSPDPAEQAALADLERWFESGDRSHPDAFERLCERYLIDPYAIRRMLRERRRAIHCA